jgi:hypothetical protein
MTRINADIIAFGPRMTRINADIIAFGPRMTRINADIIAPIRVHPRHPRPRTVRQCVLPLK